LVTSLPMCSSPAKLAELAVWILSGFTKPNEAAPGADRFIPSLFDCGNGSVARAIEDSGMYWFWAGKRTYTNAAGGRITNRFVPIASEAPGADAFARSALGRMISRLFPSLFPAGTPQTFQGLV